MRTVAIKVIEENRFADTKPVNTVRAFNDDYSVDYFVCPFCRNDVKITHWEDERGIWPEVELQCFTCKKKWGILP